MTQALHRYLVIIPSTMSMTGYETYKVCVENEIGEEFRHFNADSLQVFELRSSLSQDQKKQLGLKVNTK